jgi:hypothetical protein
VTVHATHNCEHDCHGIFIYAEVVHFSYEK